MSKKSVPILHSKYKEGQDFLDMQYISEQDEYMWEEIPNHLPAEQGQTVN